MKLKILRFIFALSICLSFFNFTFAQKNSVALKFDEFDDSSDSQFYPYQEINLSQRIERLVKQVKKERGVKVYIIYYLARQINNGETYKIKNWASHTESEVRYNAKLEYEDVVTIDGGYRENNTLEYWIAPKGVTPPKPTPTFDKSESFVCPKIYVNGDARGFDKTKSIDFSVATYNIKAEITFQWKVSAGEIVRGQGTDNITVDLKNVNDKHITAFVEVSGLPYPCGKVGYSTVNVETKLYPFAITNTYNSSELSANLDPFMSELYNNQLLKGYIVIYASRNGGVKEMERAIASVRRNFRFRNFDLNRVEIIKGGFREENTVDLWILPEGVQVPKPTPTVNDKFIAAPKTSKKSRRRK
ncbi:MAG: hypothetical protein M3033_09050 [Acidobacteriota bacterium]|nr:hypothetical protein [Acidobacteriota bacterium]